MALYGETRRWALTERGEAALGRDARSVTIGPSGLSWDGTTLTVRIDETTAPIPRPLRGTVRLHPGGFTNRGFVLDRDGKHRWWPMAPGSRIEVDLESPALRWSGPAYLDTNAGSAPLESGFTVWDWSRAKLKDSTAILYETSHKEGGGKLVAIRCRPSGEVEDFEPPPRARMRPTTIWRVPRETRSDPGTSPRAVQTLEDSPFYSRSVIETHLLGETATAVHESLSMDRFVTWPVQLMIPFRMPRALF